MLMRVQYFPVDSKYEVVGRCHACAMELMLRAQDLLKVLETLAWWVLGHDFGDAYPHGAGCDVCARFRKLSSI